MGWSLLKWFGKEKKQEMPPKIISIKDSEDLVSAIYESFSTQSSQIIIDYVHYLLRNYSVESISKLIKSVSNVWVNEFETPLIIKDIVYHGFNINMLKAWFSGNIQNINERLDKLENDTDKLYNILQSNKILGAHIYQSILDEFKNRYTDIRVSNDIEYIPIYNIHLENKQENIEININICYTYSFETKKLNFEHNICSVNGYIRYDQWKESISKWRKLFQEIEPSMMELVMRIDKFMKDSEKGLSKATKEQVATQISLSRSEIL